MSRFDARDRGGDGACPGVGIWEPTLGPIFPVMVGGNGNPARLARAYQVACHACIAHTRDTHAWKPHDTRFLLQVGMYSFKTPGAFPDSMQYFMRR
jgi:hypothetical protein